LLSPAACDFFAHVALGLGSPRRGAPPGEGEVARKGISTERTFRAVSALADMEARLRELAAALERDMAREGLRGRTVTLKLKLTTFEVWACGTHLVTVASTSAPSHLRWPPPAALPPVSA
jgi:DNA polymerase kappa